jgi:hypothetical protein
MLPVSTVEKKGFRNFVSVISPGYVPPSRNTMVEYIHSAYLDKQQALKVLIHSEAEFACYTTDLWKSAAKEYYISVALHFIDKQWKLHCPVVATTKVTGTSLSYNFSCSVGILFFYNFFLGNHKKDRIGALVADIISPFLGPNTKVHSGVTDGGEITSVKFTRAQMTNSQTYNNQLEERLCICHQLNNSIKYVLDRFFHEVLRIWRAFISQLNYSNPFFELFLECKKTVLPNSRSTERLQKDCETRYRFFLI